MAEKDNGKVFIILALIGIVLIPLLRAKPPEEPEEGLEAEIISTEYKRIKNDNIFFRPRS